MSAFRRAASDLNVAILTTFLERWPGSPRNTALLIDRHGRDVLRYAKVHTCDWGMEKALTPGGSFEVARLDVERGFVDVGVMICADREFPESARELMLGGAELILVPNACPMAGERTSQLRSRAFENMTAIATVNYSAPDQDGHSSVFDGMVFEKNGQPNGRPREQLVFEAGDGEDVYLATLDLDALREYRARETMGDAYRKPRAYRLFTSDNARSAGLRSFRLPRTSRCPGLLARGNGSVTPPRLEDQESDPIRPMSRRRPARSRIREGGRKRTMRWLLSRRSCSR